jgi:hypothetical protein
MIATWLTPTSAESAFSPEHISRIQQHRHLLAEAWALHLKAKVGTPECEQLGRICGQHMFLISNPHLI